MRELSEPAAATIADPAPVRAPAGWLVRVRPVGVLPLFAVLLDAVGYQNFVELPKMEAELAELRNPGIIASATLVSVKRRIQIMHYVARGE